MCVHVVYGEYICHHCKFILGVSEYASKSQKWPDHTDTDISKRPDCYELKWHSHIKQIVSQLHNHCYVIKRASRLICLGLIFVKLEACGVYSDCFGHVIGLLCMLCLDFLSHIKYSV